MPPPVHTCCFVLGLMHTGTNVWTHIHKCVQPPFWKHTRLQFYPFWFWNEKKCTIYTTHRPLSEWKMRMRQQTYEYRMKGNVVTDLVHENSKDQAVIAQRQYVKYFSPTLDQLYNEYVLYSEMLEKRNLTIPLHLDDVCSHPRRPLRDARLWMKKTSSKCNAKKKIITSAF